MGITAGITKMGDYVDGTNAGLQIDKLIALIPNPDVKESPNPRNPGSVLDQMSPMAAAQLRVELAALRSVVAAYAAA